MSYLQEAAAVAVQELPARDLQALLPPPCLGGASSPQPRGRRARTGPFDRNSFNPQFGYGGTLNVSCVVSFSCWPGPIGCVCIWRGGSGVVTALPGGAGSGGSTWKARIAGRQQVHGLAAAAGSLSMPSMRGSPARWCSRGRPRQGSPLLEVLLPAVSGAVRACTQLYAGSAALMARGTYIWWTGSSQRASPGRVCAGQVAFGGGGRSGL